MVDRENSLTLDNDALDRALSVLTDAMADGARGHLCEDYDEGDGCRICWEIAGDVIRAAEGFGRCHRCNGYGDVYAGEGMSCCPECGGDGLEPLAALGEDDQAGEGDRCD